MRIQLDKKLNELQNDILEMGKIVESQLALALKALKKLDTVKAKEVRDIDTTINERFLAIEEKCFQLIVTQQPAARDLRAIMAVSHMIIDLERMGDQTKGIGKVIPKLADYPKWTEMTELQDMGEMVIAMLHQTMDAYANNNLELAKVVANQDDRVDELFDQVFKQVMEKMASTKKAGKIEASYDVLRVARELERFGDLAVKIAQRIIYISTGTSSV